VSAGRYRYVNFLSLPVNSECCNMLFSIGIGSQKHKSNRKHPVENILFFTGIKTVATFR